MAEILLKSLDQTQAFSWGSRTLKRGQDRTAYLIALKEADHGNIDKLLAFAFQ